MLHFTQHNLSTRRVSFVDMVGTPNDTKQIPIHRGEVVRHAVDNSTKHIGEIADKIGRSRTSLYRDFANPEMEWTYIMRIGSVIDHDFTAEFPELSLYMERFIKEDAAIYNAKDENLERAIKEIDKWKSEAYRNLAEASKWKDLYYQLLLDPSKASKTA